MRRSPANRLAGRPVAFRRPLALPGAVLLAAGLTAAGGAGVASADAVDFTLVSHAVTVDKDAGTATFKLTFDEAPDFGVVGDAQLDAFQYEVDADTTALDRPVEWSDIDSVIRGGEIWQGNGIPVRQRDGDGGEAAGGWGPLRALVPFEIDGNTVTFTTGLSAIGDADGAFRYRVFTTSHGEMTAQAVGAVIPLPAALWTGLTLLGGIGLSWRLRRA
ncbi:MAG TPA: hypothetical protein VER17_21410 [Tepidisphaeraceae bacterium]|nr:hypothetical protein [Tepidisphaeraceae bacterium]